LVDARKMRRCATAALSERGYILGDARTFAQPIQTSGDDHVYARAGRGRDDRGRRSADSLCDSPYKPRPRDAPL
jgi:hypothetical protein